MQVAKTVDEHISAYAQVTLETVAYANSGDVLKVQALLSLAGEHIEVEEDTQWKVCPGMNERRRPIIDANYLKSCRQEGFLPNYLL